MEELTIKSNSDGWYAVSNYGNYLQHDYTLRTDCIDGWFKSEIEIQEAYETYLNIELDKITPVHYGAKCKCGKKIDPYVICDAYNIKYSAHHHAIKKLLRAGKSHKDLSTDIQEVIDSLLRLQEQLKDE